MRDQNQPLNYYEILGVSQDASTDEIRSAYRREAMQWHPDRNKDPNAPRMMQLINQAWEALGDSERRAEHDREIAQRARYYEDRSSQRDPFEEFRESILPFLLERVIDLYDVLDVSTNATFEEVEIAYLYRQETIENNPNFAGDPAATAFMSLVRIARFVLGDPEFRAEYDRHFFLLRSRIAEEERARQEATRREFERQEQERQREQPGAKQNYAVNAKRPSAVNGKKNARLEKDESEKSMNDAHEKDGGPNAKPKDIVKDKQQIDAHRRREKPESDKCAKNMNDVSEKYDELNASVRNANAVRAKGVDPLISDGAYVRNAKNSAMKSNNSLSTEDRKIKRTDQENFRPVLQSMSPTTVKNGAFQNRWCS